MSCVPDPIYFASTPIHLICLCLGGCMAPVTDIISSFAVLLAFSNLEALTMQ